MGFQRLPLLLMIFAWGTIVQKEHSQWHSIWPCWTADIVLTKQSCDSWTSRRRRLLTYSLMTPSKMGMLPSTFLFFIIKPHSGANCLFLACLWCNFLTIFFVFLGPFDHMLMTTIYQRWKSSNTKQLWPQEGLALVENPSNRALSFGFNKIRTLM